MPERALQRGQGAAADADARIDVTAQLLVVQPGVYALELASGTTARTQGGMILPCARLDPLPGSEVATFFSSLSASSLLLPGGSPGFLRTDGVTSVLLTIYKLAGMEGAPEFRIRFLSQAAAARSAGLETGIPSLPCTLTVHVERLGDLPVTGGIWAEAPGGVASIEGFSLQPADPDLAADLEYQAVLGHDWVSPWSSAGEFCGSKGMALPLLGARVRLRGAAAQTTRCLLWGRSGGGEIGPAEDEALITDAGQPLTALRVAFIARANKGSDKPARRRTTKA